jgi:hypothetical protein
MNSLKTGLKSTNGLRIGITLSLRRYDESIWTNGIRLNVLILIHLLKNSKKNYDVKILNTTPPSPDDLTATKKPKYLEDIDIMSISDKNTFENLDLIIVMGTQMHEDEILKFKSLKPSNKVIVYKCGNNYLITAESCIFKDEKIQNYQVETSYDEIWHIPQLLETNPSYYKTLYRTKNVIQVPFVWHEKFLETSLKEIDATFASGRFKKGRKYAPKKEKVLCIMEPNINIYKFCLIPIFIAEESFRTEIGKERIKDLMVTNATELKDKDAFKEIVKTLDIFKAGKFSAESRYQISFFLSQYADVIISHQQCLPLNYLYFDACWMGYPLLHNAPLVKDMGYYYEGFNVDEGAAVLNDILLHHDERIEEYDQRCKTAINRYHADNTDLIESYDLLIQNLFSSNTLEGKESLNLKLQYNKDTNGFY